MQRFDPVSRDYSKFRPEYPERLIDDLVSHVPVLDPQPLRWMDVGCGTGIFTRQIANALPSTANLVGVEPSIRMRHEAQEASSGLNVVYMDGTAEGLPALDKSLDAVSAATAAHWFDRPRFYAEAARVLKDGAILCIVEYVRDVENSAAAAAIEAYLAEQGGPKAYIRPDYEAEFSQLDNFQIIAIRHVPQTFQLSVEAYVGLALSSSHAAGCIARLGRERVYADLARIGGGLAAEDGLIPYIYRFQMFVARRNARS